MLPLSSRIALVLLSCAVLLLAACASRQDAPDTRSEACASPEVVAGALAGGNLLVNGSFEAGPAPWCSLNSPAWGAPFSVSERRAGDGEKSALLQLRSEDGGEVRVYGVTQEIAPDAFPRTLSGRYYVDDWRQGTELQYLQAVVIVWNADNLPDELVGLTSNHQIRYILAGVDRQPTFISNARYVMVAEGQPRLGEWVSFERDVRADFRELWGEVPEGFDRLRILFEVRWDDREPSDGLSAADVYYDDLYFGSGQ